MPISDDARHRMRGKAIGRERFSGGKMFVPDRVLARQERGTRGDAWKRAVARLPAPALTSIRFACQHQWMADRKRWPGTFKSHWDGGDFWRSVPGVIRRGDAFKREPDWVVLTRNFDDDGCWDV